MTGPVPPHLARDLIDWQRRHGRHHLPWQQTRDPYRVWLSEIMLQQTQVSTVLGYYERFLARFPDVAALAAAPLDDVLALWAGLGYYSRARNLHRCAQAVVLQHGGAFPPRAEALAQLPGIGRSTAAAIAAFCFGERAAILDGNVKRVLSRVLGFDEDLAQAAAERRLWALAEQALPEQAGEDMAAYTQGLMDLGATVCTPRAPRCEACPWQAGCEARRQQRVDQLPVRSRKLKRSRRANAWLWLEQGDAVWLVQRPARGVWAGLWTLPEFDDVDTLQAWLADGPGPGDVQPSFTHVLTHLDWTLTPVRCRLPAGSPLAQGLPLRWPEGRWVTAAERPGVGLPAPLRKLLDGAA